MAITEKHVAELVGVLSVTPAPLVLKNVRVVLEFLQRQGPMPQQGVLLKILRGIDLHKEVREDLLWPGDVLGRFAAAGNEYGAFYTKPGTSSRSLGINPAGKRFCRFRVIRPTPVLASRAADINTCWDGHVLASGGGIQYLLASPRHSLELIPAGDNRPRAADFSRSSS